MGEIEFVGTVSADGKVANSKLKRLANTKVRVTVTPMDDKSVRSKSFFAKHEAWSNEKAEEIKKIIKESRTISEPKVW